MKRTERGIVRDQPGGNRRQGRRFSISFGIRDSRQKRSTLFASALADCRDDIAERSLHTFDHRPATLLARSAYGVEESLTRALDPDCLFTLIRHHHPRINQGIHHKQAGQLFYALAFSTKVSTAAARTFAVVEVRGFPYRTREPFCVISLLNRLCLSYRCGSRRVRLNF